MKALATYSIKGGVGKTTAAINLAYEAAGAGARVLVWDLDPQAAATYFYRVKPRVRGGAERLVSARGALGAHIRATDVSGVHLVPSDFSLRHLDLHLDATKRPAERLASLLAGVEDRYDVAILDCPPNVSLSSESVFGAADALLVPVIPSTLSSRTLTQLDGFLRQQPRSPLLLPYFSMVDGRKRLHRELLAALRAEYPSFLDSVVPNASVIERMAPERAAIGALAPGSPSARAFRGLWSEVSRRLWP